MSKLKIGIIIGSTRDTRFGEKPARWMLDLASKREEIEAELIDLRDYDLPLFNEVSSNAWQESQDPKARAWQKKIGEMDGFIFVTAEYNRSIPGALKNAIDWGSRPYGDNAWNDKPTGVIGASPGSIGTAVGQQTLRGTLIYLNARQMTTPEAYIQYEDGLIDDDGNVTVESTEEFLRTFMATFLEYTARVLTVIPNAGADS